MAISTKHDEIKASYTEGSWESFEHYITYYLQKISERGVYNYYTNEDGDSIKIEPVNHHPELKEYEVWSEGYSATGESSGAVLFGKVKARNFSQACHMIMCEGYLKTASKINDPTYKEYVDAARWDYDPNTLSYWGCRLFWSEELARKSFG